MSEKFSFLSHIGLGSDLTSIPLGAYGEWKETLDAVRNGWRPSYTAKITLWSKLSKYLGNTATSIGGISLVIEAKDTKDHYIHPARFGYHFMSFGVSTYIGAQMGGPYGVAAGLIFTGGEITYDKVIVPHVVEPSATKFNSFVRSYLNIPSF